MLYHAEGHYSGITSMTAFLRRNYFCTHCLKGYKNKSAHRCDNTCAACHNEGVCIETDKQQCNDCHRWFVSQDCFDNHLRLRTCERLYLCQCKQLIHKRHSSGHRCGYRECTVCKSLQPIDHLCFIQPKKKTKTPNKKQHFIL